MVNHDSEPFNVLECPLGSTGQCPWQEELAHRGGGGLLRWVNIGHFFSFSFSTKRGTNPLGAPLMRSAYSMRKFRPRWTSPSSLLFFWSNLLFSLSLSSLLLKELLLVWRPGIWCVFLSTFFSVSARRRKWWTQFSQSHWGKWSSMYWVHSSRNHLLSPPLLPKVLSPNETERETMASHFLSIPEELSLVMCVYWIPFSFPLCNISKYTTHTTWKMVGWRLVTTITIRKKALPASYLSLSRMQ